LLAFLRLIQVVLKDMQTAIGEGAYIGVGTILCFILEGADDFLMIGDHHIQKGLIEILSGFLIQIVEVLLLVGRDIPRERNVLGGGYRLQLVGQFSMILDHHIAIFLYVFRHSFFFGHLAGLYFGHPAIGGIDRKALIGFTDGGSHGIR